MEIREMAESREAKMLSPYATLCVNSHGRKKMEDPCPIRTCFARDRDRILHSNSFRRLKHKTQVFIAPEGDHFRERMTHTLEVMQIARTIARALKMNEDLTEAIALGHDLGHTPFGHAGERVLNELCSKGFEHNKQSLRVVEVLENDGQGLNLTHEVKEGIVNHRTSCTPKTTEAKIVRLSDKIAYINHDIQDAERCNVLCEKDLPQECVELLGHSSSQRIGTLVVDVIRNSEGSELKMSERVYEAMSALRTFLFEHVYSSGRILEQADKAEAMLRILYAHYMNQTGSMPERFEGLALEESRERAVCDYIAGMSDQFAIRAFEALYIPQNRS